MLRPIKRLGYSIEVITSEMAGAVYLNNPFVDKLSIKRDGDLPGGDIKNWYAWFESRSREYDLFAHLSHTCEGRHALNVNQTAFWWPQDYRRKLCAGSYLETVHDVAGVAYEFGPLYFPSEEESERAAATKAKIGDNYVAWVISGSRVDKVYPYAAMAIGRIIKELGTPVVMVGAGGKQFEMAKQIMEHVRRQNSTTGRLGMEIDGLPAVDGLYLALSPDGADPGGEKHWSLRRSLAQTLAADLVISPDTGFAWAAAFEPMPKIVTLSHASAENITKHWVNTTTLHADPVKVPCWPCHRLHDGIETCVPNKDGGNAAACISDITVETIVSEADRLLRGRSSMGNVVPLREAAAE